MNGYLSAMRSYAAFRGRASRAEYWQFTILTFIIVFVALVLDNAVLSGPDSRSHPFAGLVVLAHVLPGLAVSVRRLHDTDHSGWFLFINIIPLVGLVVLLIWACQAGTPGANQYGPAVTPALPLPETAGAPTIAPTGQPVRRDVIAEIERLAQLRASGNLTEAEFTAMKARALAEGASA